MKRIYYPVFDLLRLTGFTIVYIAHIGQKYKEFFIAGKSAVVLFFLISSFLFITHLLQNIEAMNTLKHWFTYIIKRIIRLYPMYIFVLLLELISGNYSFSKAISHLLLIDARQHYWTIPVLIQFYLLVPFIAFLLKKINKLGMKYSLIFMLTVYILLGFFYREITFPFIYQNASQINIVFYLPSFIIGIIMSLTYMKISEKKIRISFPVLVSFILITIALLMLLLNSSFKMFTASGLGDKIFMPLSIFSFFWSLLIILMLFVKNEKAIGFFENKIINYLGKISYNAYLLHILVINFVYIFFKNNFFSAAILGYILTIIISSVTYELINKNLNPRQKAKQISGYLENKIT